MKRIEAVVRPERLGMIAAELEVLGFKGFTISDVRGHGQSPEKQGEWRGQTYELHVTHKLKVEIYVEDAEVESVTGAIGRGAWTGRVGDGLISVSDVTSVTMIRNLPSPTPRVTT
ncbi:MAG: P-II family nitrogen regulator [Actinomycetota bacterium]